jgi:capsule biosynthesis phosphatase
MRIVIDLDKTIAESKKDEQSYWHLKPNPGVIEKLKQWRLDGHYIIIHTARHMVTCKGDIDLVLERIGKLTWAWLLKWGIPYDELIFGKPYGHVYVDDKALKFEDNWDTITLPIQS